VARQVQVIPNQLKEPRKRTSFLREICQLQTIGENEQLTKD
jgi:hypothetical protein